MGLEVFMVKRHHAVAFMAGAYVFPGGRVDDPDHDGDASWCDGLDTGRDRIDDLPVREATALRVAAARELFEESGVLVARDSGGSWLSLAAPDAAARFAQLRHDVHDGRRTFRDAAVSEGLRLALDALVYVAHWVTPPLDVRRFDTRFFLARLPAHQTPSHDASELTEDVWVTPTAALAAASRGEMVLPPPTWITLRELEGFASVDDALAWARRRVVHRREPLAVEEDGVRRIFLPGDARHPDPHAAGSVGFETRFVLADGRWRPEKVA